MGEVYKLWLSDESSYKDTNKRNARTNLLSDSEHICIL